ncbi:MAG: inositol monophosphatase family protein [Patescibacteria group bacterium]|jgi:myo-inositol-1(or 4)-monophosphatase
MKTFNEYYEIAKEAAERASVFLRGNYGPAKEMTLKEGTHYSINDDLLSNEIYEKFLRERTPEVAIYTEEGERNLNSDLVWVIDPIEGTSNYRVGIPLFATQICLLYKGEPVVAVIQAPVLNLLFTAQKGEGAYLNGQKITVSSISELKLAMLGYNKGLRHLEASNHINKLIPQFRTIRNFGVAGIDLVFAASGKLDLVMNANSELYDYAPGVLLVREAGGRVTNFAGVDWKTNDKTLIAANKKLLTAALEAIRN